MNNNFIEAIRAKTPLRRQFNYFYGRCVLCEQGLMKIYSQYFYCSNCTTKSITIEEFQQRERIAIYREAPGLVEYR